MATAPHFRPQELAIMQGMSDGLTADEIAKMIGWSTGHIRHVQYDIRQKLGAKTLQHAVAIALRQKIIT